MRAGRSKNGVWKGEEVDNEEAARDVLKQSDKQTLSRGSGGEGKAAPCLQPRAGPVKQTPPPSSEGETKPCFLSKQ